MQPTTETIQGELLALRCHIAALMESQPLQSQLRFRAKLETSLLLLRPAQPGERQAAFDRAVNSLAVKRQPSSSVY
jgi:hypothetical protein